MPKRSRSPSISPLSPKVRKFSDGAQITPTTTMVFRRRRNYRRPYRRYRRAYNPKRTPTVRYDRATGAPYVMQRTVQPRPILTDAGLTRYGLTWSDATQGQKVARIKDKFYGYGDYKSDLWKNTRGYIPRALGALAGGLATKSLQGAARGWGVGADASKLIGWGDYGPRQDNQIIEGSPHTPMQVNPSEDLTGDIFFSHREFLCNVENTTANFVNRSFEINPGLESTFPFLSQLAACFTLYEFQGLIFEYRPLSGEFGTTGSPLGKVVITTNYDPDAEPFENSLEMENYDYSNSTKPSIEMLHGVETDPGQRAVNMKYIRTGSVARDKIFTDIGLFQVATEGISDTGVIGQIWVSYRIKLSRAKLHHTVGNSYKFASFAFAKDVVGGVNLCNSQDAGGQINTSVYEALDRSDLPNTARTLLALQPLTSVARRNTNGTLDAVILQESGFPAHVYLVFPADVKKGAVFLLTLTWEAQNGSQGISSFVGTNCEVTATNEDVQTNGILPTTLIGVSGTQAQGVCFVRITDNATSSDQPYLHLRFNNDATARPTECSMYVQLSEVPLN